MEISSVIIRTIATYNSMIYVVSHVKSNLFEKINIANENNTISQGCPNREFTLNRKRIVRSKNRKSQPKLVVSTQTVLLNRKGKSRSHNQKSQPKSMDSTHNSTQSLKS
jgi:hypothetical protein